MYLSDNMAKQLSLELSQKACDLPDGDFTVVINDFQKKYSIKRIDLIRILLDTVRLNNEDI